MELYRLAQTDFTSFAKAVTKDADSELGQAQTIVRWLAKNLEWKATDYQKRTVQEIINRGGGNCNELATVAVAAMQELGIKLRRVHEVNIYTNTPRRGEDARAMIKEKGNTYSVFGRHHNDHVWLELYDSKTKDWYPADPSSGLVGMQDWMQGRMSFGKRTTMNPITDDMIVVFAVYAADDTGKYTISRTNHYIVEAFDRYYSGELHQQRAWKEWITLVDLLDKKVGEAFAGTTDLHDYETQIDKLAETYEQFRASSTHQ